jgi:uncharacterized protein (DUF1697 family)
MTVFVAFIRGINVGLSKKVAMPRLREVITERGYQDVATLLNSGNLIVRSGKGAGAVEQDVADVIEREFGFRCDVMVRTAAQLRTIVTDNPFPDGQPNQVNVAFCLTEPPAEVDDRLAAAATDRESFEVRGREVYVDYRDGLGRSKLAATFPKVVKVSTTVRTIRTVQKLLAALPE